jgi:tRNA1Val (adenine37-N6)-methyltransferase
LDCLPSARRDTLFSGAVTLWQPARGYRVNIDALLLAKFAAQAGGKPSLRALDLGAGVGAVILGLYHLGGAGRLELVEREPELCELARNNLADAGAVGAVHCADLEADGLPRSLHEACDLIVCNPPYFEPGQHRPTAERQIRAAKLGRLEPFMDAAARALQNRRARAAFVYPARSLEALLIAARAASLVAKRMRFVHADAGAPARLVLCELRRARPGGLLVEPPLIEWSAKGVRSREVQALIDARPERAADQR